MKNETYSLDDKRGMVVYGLLHDAKDVSERLVEEFLDGSELKYLRMMIENKAVENNQEKGVYNLTPLGKKIDRIRFKLAKRKKQGF